MTAPGRLDRTEADLSNSTNPYDGPRILTGTLFVCAVILVVAGSLWTSWVRPLWYDELFSFYVARQPSASEVVHALRSGADNHPPVDYLIRHLSLKLPGEPHFAFRLPSVVSFLVFCSCMFLFVRRRAGTLAGMTAFLIPVSTAAYRYGLEGRPYASLLALAGVSAVAWQSLGHAAGMKRWLHAAVLAIGLAAGVNTHYYGALLYPAFIAGEVARCWIRREMQYFTFGALAASLVGLATVLPFARAASSYAHGFWTPVDSQSLTVVYGALFGLAAFIVLVLAALLCAGKPEPGAAGPCQAEQDSFKSDMFLGVCLMGVVPVCYLVAATVTSAFLYRYVLVAAGGLAIVVPLVLVHYAYRKSSAYVLVITAAVTGLTNIAWQARENAWLNGSLDSMRAKVVSVINATGDGRYPIVWADHLECFPVTYHFPALTRDRVYCLSGPQEASTFDRAAKGLARWTDLPIRDQELFMREHREFWLVGVSAPLYHHVRCEPVATDQKLRLGKCISQPEQQ